MNRSNCLEMRCYKYTNVCPRGGDKLETTASFIVTQNILLSLIHCHCPYSLTRGMIRGNKRDEAYRGFEQELSGSIVKKKKSCLQLILFDLIIKYSTVLHLPEVRQKFSKSSGNWWHAQPPEDRCASLQSSSISCQCTVRCRQKGVTISSTQIMEIQTSTIKESYLWGVEQANFFWHFYR